MKDKIIDILKYVWNPKFDLNNEYEYQHLHGMANFILDALNNDQRKVKISEFLKRNSIEKYQGDISPDKSDSVTSLILGWANPVKKWEKDLLKLHQFFHFILIKNYQIILVILH